MLESHKTERADSGWGDSAWYFDATDVLLVLFCFFYSFVAFEAGSPCVVSASPALVSRVLGLQIFVFGFVVLVCLFVFSFSLLSFLSVVELAWKPGSCTP